MPKKKLSLKDDLIVEETFVNWYQDMQPWQRQELTREELFQYAEEMRQALDRIFDIAYNSNSKNETAKNNPGTTKTLR